MDLPYRDHRDMRKRCFDDNSKTEYNSDLEISFVPTNLMITVFLNNVSEYIRSFEAKIAVC